jgi:hypothetical protein
LLSEYVSTSLSLPAPSHPLHDENKSIHSTSLLGAPSLPHPSSTAPTFPDTGLPGLVPGGMIGCGELGPSTPGNLEMISLRWLALSAARFGPWQNEFVWAGEGMSYSAC